MNANEISPKTNVRMSRIKTIIRVIRFLVSATIIFVIVVGSLFLADLAGFHFFPSGVKASFSPMLTYSSPFKVPAAVLVLAFLRAGLFFAGALILFWLLDLFEAGKFFTAQHVRYIKWLGWFVVSDWVVVRLLDALAKGFSPDPVELAAGLLIVLSAWIMDEGRKIQEEQELTV
jgi:hypothetical protein